MSGCVSCFLAARLSSSLVIISLFSGCEPARQYSKLADQSIRTSRFVFFCLSPAWHNLCQRCRPHRSPAIRRSGAITCSLSTNPHPLVWQGRHAVPRTEFRLSWKSKIAAALPLESAPISSSHGLSRSTLHTTFRIVQLLNAAHSPRFKNRAWTKQLHHSSLV